MLSSPVASSVTLAVAAAAVSVGVSASGFFFNDTATTEIYALSLHDALPIFTVRVRLAVSSSPACRVRPLRSLWLSVQLPSVLCVPGLRLALVGTPGIVTGVGAAAERKGAVVGKGVEPRGARILKKKKRAERGRRGAA